MQNDLSRGSAQRVIASYGTYEGAQAAVDRLADQHFPVERLVIVGRDLKIVEQVTGRLNYPRVAAAGAASGALLGALLGLIFSIFLPAGAGISVLGVVLYWLVAGAFAGAALGLVNYGLTRGRRDFASVSGMQAGSYDVLADEDVADAAVRGLTEGSGLGAGTAGAR